MAEGTRHCAENRATVLVGVPRVEGVPGWDVAQVWPTLNLRVDVLIIGFTGSIRRSVGLMTVNSVPTTPPRKP